MRCNDNGTHHQWCIEVDGWEESLGIFFMVL